MSIESYLMELVCSTRWICNLLLASPKLDGSQSSATDWSQKYPGDVETAKQALYALSKTHSHVEDMEEIPEGIVATLCEGALYLLASEAILGHCPPTMHQFLQQTTLQRQQSATQAQLLLLRWLLTAEILQIDNVLGTIFEDTVALEDYATDYDAHMAIARYLAQTEPFYLGAHVMILRGLLLHYINDSLQGEDVMSHLQLISPEAVAGSSSLMIEDALLLWIRGVLGLFTAELNATAAKRIGQEICHVDDLYLHTNDGRVLALVIHHYKPALMDLNLVHLATPLSMWQRQDNWTHIIRAAEALGVWVGVFADEMVAHGFVTLQQHLLRIVQDLFLVLACDAEENYEALRKTIEESTAGARDDSLCNESSELEGHTDFIGKNVMHSMMIGPATPPPVLVGNSGSRGAYETLRDNGDRTFDGDIHRDTVHSRETIETSATTPAPSATESGRGGQNVSRRLGEETPSDADGHRSDDEKEQLDVLHQHEDFNIVMTGLFLQGVSIPLRRQEQNADEVKALSGVGADTDSMSGPKSVEVLPLDVGHALPAMLAGTTAPAQAEELSDSNQPPRSESPILVGRSAELRRQRVREDNAVASSVAHFKELRATQKKGADDAVPNRFAGAANQTRMSMVQGSMDSDGIEGLLRELATITQAPPPRELIRPLGGDGGDPLAEAREQNHALRWALDEQRRKVSAMVEKLRRGIRKQEFSAIVKHLKDQKQQRSGKPSDTSSGVSALRKSSSAFPDITFAKASTCTGDVAVREAAARRCEDAMRRSVENVRGSQRLQLPERLVVSNVGGKCSDKNDVHSTSLRPDEASEVQQLSKLPSIAKASRGGVALHFSTSGVAKPTDVIAPSSRPSVVQGEADKGDGSVRLASLETVRNTRKAGAATQQLVKTRRNSSGGEPDPTVTAGEDGTASLASTTHTAAAAAAPVTIKTKSNKSVMILAFKHVLLTGQLNKAPLEKVLSLVNELTEEGGHQFVILFKDEFTQQFKGLYTVRLDAVLVRVYGSGPYMAYAGPQPTNENESVVWAQGLPYLFPKFFKFDSGSKTFQPFSAKWVNQAADGVAFAAAKPKMMDRERF